MTWFISQPIWAIALISIVPFVLAAGVIVVVHSVKTVRRTIDNDMIDWGFK